jgi:hypothetical protein
MTDTEIPKLLADYLVDAIKKDYLLTVLISSYTQAKKKTKNLPFGIGKTTLEFELSYIMNGGSEDFGDLAIWDTVFAQAAYNPLDLGRMLKPAEKRKNCVVWDDVQATAPAEQGVPKAIRRLANFMSTERPEVACFIMTAPNISMISSPLRKLIIFEIIVVERGQYEVQKITYHKDFDNPTRDLAKLEYIEETATEKPFPPLPEPVMTRFKTWRATQKLQLYPALIDDLDRYTKLRDFTIEPLDTADMEGLLTTSGRIIKNARGYYLKVDDTVGEKLHMQKVQAQLSVRDDKAQKGT